MRTILGLATAALLLSWTHQAEAGIDDPMGFYRATSGGNCATCYWVVAEGVIETDTAEVFRDFLAREDLVEARGITIHLNSPGGSLMGGVYLGRAIRAQQANTVVSAGPVEDVYDDGTVRVGWDPSVTSECSSACVFAFAGGVSRFASVTTPGSAIGFQDVGRLGVHQFYSASALADPSAATLTAEDRIADQRTVSILLGFLSEMDVSAELLQLAGETDPRDMHYLDEEELRRTRVDNRMVRNVFLTGYRNGVAIAEVTYRRLDGDYRLEIYCRDGAMHMLATIDWRGSYDVDGHRRWNLFDNVSLTDGGELDLVSEEFSRRADGGITGSLLFRFADPMPELVERTTFVFTDWSSRYANDSATSMSFVLPSNFDGLHLLPRTCM